MNRYMINYEKKKCIMKFPHFLPKSYSKVIEILSNMDENIKESILNEKPYVFSIYLEDLKLISPKNKSSKDAYNGLINFLKNIGIEMRIISRKSKPEIVNLINYMK